MQRCKLIAGGVLIATLALSIGLGLALKRSHERLERFDMVCDSVRERMCLARNVLTTTNQRPRLPDEIAVSACAPGVWDDWKIAHDNDLSELRLEMSQVIDAIPWSSRYNDDNKPLACGP